MGCTVDEDLIFKPMSKSWTTPTAVATPPKPTTVEEAKAQLARDCMANADEVLLTSKSSEAASTKWDFRLRTVAAPGQKVFLLRNNRVIEEKVMCVRVHITEPKLRVQMSFDYKVEYSICDEEGEQLWVSQDTCFATKADLLASL
jgi:hypothetical protein